MRYKPRKIIVAHSDRDFLVKATRILERMGFAVAQAENSSGALDILNGTARPDLLMLDPYLQRMEGLDALQTLRQNTETLNVPFVLLLADTGNPGVSEFRKTGFTDFIGIPLDIDSLHEVLQRLLFSNYGQTRKHVRAEIDSSIRVSYPGSEETLKATTISEGGIYFLRDEPLPVGAELSIRIPGDKGRDMEMEGRVIYINPFNGEASEVPPGMAVKFLDVSERTAEMIAEFVIKTLSA